MSDKTAPGAARITKTMRVAHSIVQSDIDAGIVNFDLVFDTPFVDTNFTATVSVATTNPAVDVTQYFALGFIKAVDKVTVPIEIDPGIVGDAIEIHVHAIHD